MHPSAHIHTKTHKRTYAHTEEKPRPSILTMRPFLERAKKQQQSHNVNTNKSTFLSTTLYAAYRNTRCCLKALTQEQWGVAHLAPLGSFQPARPLEQKTGDLKRGGAFVEP